MPTQRRTRCLLLVAVSALLGACQTLEERLGERVACNHKTLTVHHQLHVPAYTQYEFVCEGKKFTCRDAPFYSNCHDGWHRDKKNDKRDKKKKS